MKFENRLNDLLRLGNPDIEEVPRRGSSIPREMYDAYVKYVGKLDAIPYEELTVFDIRSDGKQVLPLSSWPTKSTRANAQQHWTKYNQDLQNDTAPQEPEVDPCSDPTFISDLLDTCIRVAVRGGKMDKSVAYRRCSRQVGKLAQAIKAACSDRGLTGDEFEDFTQSLFNQLSLVAGTKVGYEDLSPEDKAFIDDTLDGVKYKPQ